MRNLSLTLAIEETDLTRALIGGAVTSADLTLQWVAAGTEERHDRMIREEEYDICEFSISQYFTLRERNACGFTALPVFPRRMFGQRFLFCRSSAGIQRPEDLAGKRVLVGRYQNSLALWLRGYLEHEFGVAPTSMRWLRLREEAFDFEAPPKVDIQSVPADARVEDLVVHDQIDAVMIPSIPLAFLDGTPYLRRVFRDVRAVEIEYFRRTADFPIMHVLVVRDQVLQEAPWVAARVRQLFEESKARYYEYASQPFRLGQPFGSLIREEERVLMGPDPWAFGIEPNERSLRLLTQYAWEQGLTRRRLEVAELFPSFSE